MPREPEAPATPPRARNSAISTTERTPDTLGKGMLHTPVTAQKKVHYLERPTLARTNKKQKQDLLLSPEFTPQRHKKDFILQLQSPKKALSTKKSTIGSGRSQGLLPSIKINPISERSEDKHSLIWEGTISRNLFHEIDCSESTAQYEDAIKPNEETTECLKVPSTPKKNIITEELTHNWHGQSRKDDFSDSDEDILDYHLLSPTKKVKRELTNPFIESNTKAKKRSLPILNPFFSSEPEVDYSTHTELINKRTGKKKVRELNSRERQIKPKRLNFEGIVNSSTPPSSPSQVQLTSSPTPSPSSSPFSRKSAITSMISKKYVLKNLKNTLNTKSRNELDFEIFNDSEQ